MLKKIFVFFISSVLFLNSFAISVLATEITGSKEYLKKYAAVLQNYVNDTDGDREFCPKFQLIYINDDSIPELIVTEDTSAHLAGVYVYTYVNGNAVNISEDGFSYGSYGEIYYSAKKNMILSEVCAQSTNILEFYRISSNGREELICSFTFDAYEKAEKYYIRYANEDGYGREVTKDTFSSTLSLLTKGNDFRLAGIPTGADLTNGNIRKMMSEETIFYGPKGAPFIFDSYLGKASGINISAERSEVCCQEVMAHLGLFQHSEDEGFKWYYTDKILRRAKLYPDKLEMRDYSSDYFFSNVDGLLLYMVYTKNNTTSKFCLDGYGNIVRSVMNGVQKDYPKGISPENISDDIAEAIRKGEWERAIFAEEMNEVD